MNVDQLNARAEGRLAGLVGLEVLEATQTRIRGALLVRPELQAPTGFLHTATIIAMLDTYGDVGERNGARNVRPLSPSLYQWALAVPPMMVALSRSTSKSTDVWSVSAPARPARHTQLRARGRGVCAGPV